MASVKVPVNLFNLSKWPRGVGFNFLCNMIHEMIAPHITQGHGKAKCHMGPEFEMYLYEKVFCLRIIVVKSSTFFASNLKIVAHR